MGRSKLVVVGRCKGAYVVLLSSVSEQIGVLGLGEPAPLFAEPCSNGSIATDGTAPTAERPGLFLVIAARAWEHPHQREASTDDHRLHILGGLESLCCAPFLKALAY